MCVREDGIHISGKKDTLIAWKKHEVIEGKYGIAVISFRKIHFLILKDAFSPEQYEQIF